MAGSSWSAQSVLCSRSYLQRAKLVVGHNRDDTRDEDDSSERVENGKRIAIHDRWVERDEASDEAAAPSSERLDVPLLREQVLYRRDVPDADENLRENIGTPSVAGQKSVGNDRTNATEIPFLERLEAYIAITPYYGCEEHDRYRNNIHRIEDAGTEVAFLRDRVRRETQPCSEKEDDPRRERGTDLSLPNLIRIPNRERHHH